METCQTATSSCSGGESVTVTLRSLTHPQQLLVLLLQLAFQVPHPLLYAPVTLLRLQMEQRQDNRGHGDLRVSQPDKIKAVATTQAKASNPKLKDGDLLSEAELEGQRLETRSDGKGKMENKATEGRNDRRRELLQRSQVGAPARRAMQLSRSGGEARADTQSHKHH